MNHDHYYYWVFASVVAVAALVYLCLRAFGKRNGAQTVDLSDWVAEQHRHGVVKPGGSAQERAGDTLPAAPDQHPDADLQPAPDGIEETAPAVLGPPEWRPPPR